MKPITLDPEKITKAISEAASETDAIVEVFRQVYGAEWDNIETTEGYSVCNRETWMRICALFRDLSDRLNLARAMDKQIMPAGAWMNWGFSIHDDRAPGLKNWQVLPASVTVKAPASTERLIA